MYKFLDLVLESSIVFSVVAMVVVVFAVLGSIQTRSGRRYGGNCLGTFALKASSMMVARFVVKGV